MLASDYFCAQSETRVRISRGTGSVRVASQGLSRPFLKTVTAVFPDPTDRLQASKDCKRPLKRQRHSGRLREEVAYEKNKNTATLPRRFPDTSTSWNMIYCFDLYVTICAIPYFVLKFFVYHKKPSTHSECRARSYNA